MMRSTGRILTTHVGSLPRPVELLPLLLVKDASQPYDAAVLEQKVSDSVNQVLHRQADVGIDIANDGEHSKSVYSGYLAPRLSGLEVDFTRQRGSRGTTRDELEFPDAYEDRRLMNAARPRRTSGGGSRPQLVCRGPIQYVGQDHVQADIHRLLSALRSVGRTEGFMTAISPTHPANSCPNEYYPTQEEYAIALADALAVEYRAIVDAGLILQIDDPLIANYYDHHPEKSLEECRAYIASQVEVINHALHGIPEERVRFHTCYGVNIAPRAADLPLKDYVDLMLQINAGGYSFEAANPRHEHEWQVWEDVRLPEHKVLIPGVISHCVEQVEHPELVAQRIARFATVVGRERVLASNDCGFGTSSAGDQLHESVAWAKLKALSEGAALASQRLWAH